MDCFSIQSSVLFCSAAPLVGSVRQDHPPLDPMSEPYRSAGAVIRNWTPGRQLNLTSKQGNADPELIQWLSVVSGWPILCDAINASSTSFTFS